jgi:hypothetical protein
MSETVKDRANKYGDAYANSSGGRRVQELLTEFGEAERKRAVKECEEAVRKAWRFSGPLAHVADATDNLGEIEAALRALISPPVPVWCEHIMYDKVPTANGPKLWYLLYQKSELCTAWDGSECPICGALKPEVAK